MKVLFVHPVARYAIWDVARGYRSAFERASVEIKDYYLDRRMAYHQHACPEKVRDDRALMSRFASECIPNEACYMGADLVFIVSGLLTHPCALFVLGKIGIPAAVVLTESPYDDDVQKNWLDQSYQTNIAVYTHEKISAMQYGWGYLPHAYDPDVHQPVDLGQATKHDVLLVGTGWRERQMFLEAVDWSGVNLGVYGPKDAWPAMTEKSAIWDSFHNEPVDNAGIAPRYAAAKICLNFHRRHPDAFSPNPRAYEIAACGAFQLSDPRPGVTELFGDSVPIFDSPEELGRLVRRYLNDEPGRMALAAESRRRVRNETFDVRTRWLLESLAQRFKLPWLQEA